MEEMGEAASKVSPEFTVKTTKENLEDAIAGESYEISTMYPEFLPMRQRQICRWPAQLQLCLQNRTKA
ncbi:MAG: hypothetical protein H6573_11600 [Lewinellaceae bacterium]|nr:hypothetical protein [Lewinellaceae bacterium]